MGIENEAVEQEVSKTRGRKSVSWRKDPLILARLAQVEPLYLERKTNVAIAAAVGVDEITVRRDIERLRELWLERHGRDQDQRRAEVLAELADVKARALASALFDETAERAVLLGEEMIGKDGKSHFIQRDDKGSAQFRGNKAAALTVARQAIMDAAKVQGLVVEKAEIAGKDGGPVHIDLTGLSDEELAVVAELRRKLAAPAGGD